MNNVLRALLGTVSIVAAISLNNYIIDAESSFLTTLAIAVIFQCITFVLGAVFGLFAYFVLLKNKDFINDDPELKKTFSEIQESIGQKPEETPVLEESDEVEVNVAGVCCDNYKSIGKYHNEDIYEFIDVTFDNGIMLQYKFDTTLSTFKEGNFNVSSLPGGALVLDPGIIYVPA